MPNRYVCSALEELRESLSKHFTFIDLLIPEASENEYHMTRRQHHIKGLVEEIQTYVNRMEASLGDAWDLHHEQERKTELQKDRRELNKKVKKLKAQVKLLESKLGGDEDGEGQE